MFNKNRNLVIMDGSDAYNVFIVRSTVELFGGKKCIKECRSLDEEHPTMKVIKFKANRKAFEDIKLYLNEMRPGLCIYDVAV